MTKYIHLLRLMKPHGHFSELVKMAAWSSGGVDAEAWVNGKRKKSICIQKLASNVFVRSVI